MQSSLIGVEFDNLLSDINKQSSKVKKKNIQLNIHYYSIFRKN